MVVFFEEGNIMNKKLLTKTPVVCGLAIICCLLWGSAFPCIKIGYQMFNIPSGAVGSQFLFAGIRFTLAGILTILFGSLLSKKILVPKKESLFSVFKLSMVQTVLQYVFFYIGLANTSGVKSSIINAANVFLSILFAVFIFKYEKMTVLKVLGCVVGFLGVVVINLANGGFDMSIKLSGEGAILLSAAAYALSSGMIKKYSKDENPVVLSGYQFFLGGIILVVVGIATGGKISGFTLASIALLIYMAMISAVAYTLWGILLKYNPVGKVAVFGFTNPTVAIGQDISNRTQTTYTEGDKELRVINDGHYVYLDRMKREDIPVSLSDEEVKKQAETFLRDNSLLPEGFSVRGVGYSTIETDIDPEPQIVEKTVGFFRKIDGYDVYGRSDIMVTYNEYGITEVYSIYNNYELYCVMECKTLEEAQSDILSPDSWISTDAAEFGQARNIQITECEIIYYDKAHTSSDFIQPCIAFIGTITDEKGNSARFSSTVPALKEECYN